MPNSTKAGLRPDLYEVLTAVRARPGEATYYYRNVLAGQGHRDLRTATVLRRLRRLEALGKVRLARTNYAVMLAWEPAPDVDALSRARASGIQVNEGGERGLA